MTSKNHSNSGLVLSAIASANFVVNTLAPNPKHRIWILGENGAGCFFEVKITLRGQKGIENSAKGRKEIGKNGTVAFFLFDNVAT
jgi:hypothetical protein